jgi:KaiC/GvpD/RAD55 family RecA-like ATPase
MSLAPLADWVEELTELSCSLWETSYSGDDDPKAADGCLLIDLESYEAWRADFLERGAAERKPLRDEIVAKLEDLGWLRSGDRPTPGVNIGIYRPNVLLNTVLGRQAREADRAYFLFRSLRRRYRCQQSPQPIQVFHTLAASANEMIQPDGETGAAASGSDPPSAVEHPGDSDGSPHCSIRALRQRLVAALKANTGSASNDVSPATGTTPVFSQADIWVDLFLDCCRAVGYLEPRWDRRRKTAPVILLPAWLDAEYLLSQLFGLKTSIQGLDDLFGGGGIALADNLPSSPRGHVRPSPRGRAVLVRGEIGSGKSTLGLSLAAEVVRKGGLAWVVPLEQSEEECLNYLSSIGEFDLTTTSIAVGAMQAGKILVDAKQAKQANRGALIILRTDKHDLEAVLERLVSHARDAEPWPLRLLMLDPLNSIVQDRTAPASALRSQLSTKLAEITKSGANVLLVAERAAVAPNEAEDEITQLATNVSDTVIDLTRADQGYSQRYIEIVKSRFQREARGRHPFSIRSGRGVAVLPSPAAVAARIRTRRVRDIRVPEKFGWKALDRGLLGGTPLFPSDVVVLRGADGTFKTHIGLMFLLQNRTLKPSDGRRRASLLFLTREHKVSIERLLESRLLRRARKDGQEHAKKEKDVVIVELTSGFVQSGYILQVIEEQFDKAARRDMVIDRVMVDDVGHWETSCPFIRQDQTFGEVLVDLLRRKHVTSLFVCDTESKQEGSNVQQSIVENASALIELRRVQFRGAQRVLLQVAKSSGMDHRREVFDVTLTDDTLELGESMLRVEPSGEISAVKPVLYLHDETPPQKEYNRLLRRSLRPVLSPDLKIESTNRTNIAHAVRFGAYSTVDQMQVVQVDEFQLPELTGERGGRPVLYRFAANPWWSEDWSEISPNLVARAKRKNAFAAIPYFSNIGLLVIDRGVLSAADLASAANGGTLTWQQLAIAAEHHDRETRGAPFFSFTCGTGENYNTLFFEIALGMGLELPRGKVEQTLAWFKNPRLVEVASVMRVLCRAWHFRQRNHKRLHGQSGDGSGPVATAATPVARHWFTTAHEYLAQHGSALREPTVALLPGGASIAGEWYLGVPAYSAAPYLALELMKALTTREAELERLRYGVGLPVRPTFYQGVERLVTTHFELDDPRSVLSRIENAGRRSKVPGYSALSPVLTFHLRKIIEVGPPPSDSVPASSASIETDIKKLLSNMHHVLTLLLQATEAEDRTEP